MAVLYTNNAASNLSASITNTATSFSVTSGQGALFPAITGSDYFYVTLLDNSGNIEIVKVTARNTDTFTVTRAQDGTTARAWSANDKVELRITRSMLDDLKGERMPVYGPSVGSGGRVMINMSGNPAWSDANFTYDVIMGQFRATSFRANVGDSAPTWNFNNILHAGNYSSYALPLTGGALTGLTSITGGSFDTTYTSTQTRFADGGVQAMKTVDAGVFEAIRAVNLATTAGTTVRLVAAATSDAFNNTNGGKVFIDAVRTATNMDLVFSLNATAGAAPTERVRFFGGGGIQLDGTNTVLHAGNYTSYGDGRYVLKTGDTMTGALLNGRYLSNYSVTPYYWNGTSLQFYWTKIANINSVGDAHMTIQISAKTDVNYVPHTIAIASVAAFNNSTQSIKLDALTSYDITINLAVDNSGNIWLYAGGAWSSYLSWRFLDVYGSPTIYTSAWTQQLTTPANSVSIQPGQQVRGSQGAMSSATPQATSNQFGSINTLGAILQANNQVLHAGNYTSYSPSLTGSGASGTWGINVTGNAATSTILKSVNTTSTGVSTWNPQGLTYQAWGQYFTHSSLTADSGDLTLWLRASQYSGGGTELCMMIDGDYYAGTGQYKVLHAGNYTSYSPSLTGTGASGTWGINISGYAYGLNTLDTDRSLANRLPTSTGQSVRFDFASASVTGTGGNYAGVMTFSPWTGTTASTGDASYQLAFGSTATNGGGNPQLRLRKGIDSTWNSWVDVLTSANISSYALPLTGGTLSGNLLITNAASPNTYYFQFGDNSGWKFRYMTNVSGTPTERFGFTDTGNFSAVGSVTWGSGNAAAVMNSGNPRSLAIGFSGGNYGGASYGVNYTTTSGSHTYAFADIVSRWDAYDGLIVYAAPSGTVGATVSWTNVLDARRSNASLIFKGNTVLDASNYTNYVAGLGGGNYTGTIQVTQSGVVDAFKSVNTSTTLTDESSLRFQKTMTPTGTATTNSLGGMEWEGKNSNGTSYEMARIYATNITSTSLDSGNYAVGELHLASYRYIGGYSESVRMRLSGGNIYWHFSGTERLRQDSAKIYPSTSGAYNLGDASFKFGTVFTNSITFGDGTTQSTGIPTTYTISYLVVAGGGGGGNSGNSGGGGGGGVLAANVSLAVGTTYSVTVGAGGAVNAVGGSSSFGLFATANGGGAGGAANAPGGNGGSGGGGGFMNAAQAGGSGTAGQGYAGGASTTAYGGGGGGGAGAVGNAGTGNGGNGGTGFTSSITGTTTVYGGGGGGGSNAGQGLGGSGGGGNGGPGTSTAGAVNTGGGGGGFGNTTVGRGGGSGVVILQIPTSNYTGLTTGSPTVTTSGSYTILKFTSSGSYTA